MVAFIDFTPENFDQYIEQQEKPVIVDFWATWSIASLMHKSSLEVARDYNEDWAIFGSVNIDAQPELTQRFSIITLPTTLVFWKGEIVKQYMGIQEPEVFNTLIAELLSPPETEEETDMAEKDANS